MFSGRRAGLLLTIGAVAVTGAAGRVLAAETSDAGAGPTAAVDVTEDTADTAEAVVVTGTRATGRTVANSASPVDVISSRELQQTGASSVLEALNRLAPSLNLPASNNPDLGSIIRGAQLRGLDPSYTLVLVNGKRRHTTAYVGAGFPGSVAADLALIPLAAIDHIEVLRDGASAIYGSDAIAGVVNIILKSDRSGGDDAAQWGKTYKGDGAVKQLSANQGFELGPKGFLNASVEVDRQDQAVRNFALRPTYLSYPAIAPNGSLVKLGPNNSLPAGDSPNPAEATRNSNPWQNNGQPAFSTVSADFNAGYKLNDSVELYGFGTFAHRVAFSPENFRLPNTIFTADPSGLSVFPDGFTPYENTNEVDYQANIGLRGAVAGWSWDLSTGFGKDNQNVYTRHTLNYSLTYPDSPTDFYDGAQIYSDWTSNLDISRAFDTGVLPQPLQVSFGVEGRHERDQVTAGASDSYYGQGASSLIGNLPADVVDNTRSSEAAYAGLSTYITSRWFVDAAVRGEHYSDFGSTVTGKFATRFDVNDRLGFRATVSNGFHAPALATESYNYTLDMNGTTSKTLQPATPAAIALGASALQPEKSLNYALGVTFEPVQGLHAALDAYRILVSHRLGTSSEVGINTTSGIAVDPSGKTLTAAQVAYIEGMLTAAGIAIPQNGGVNVSYYTDVGDTRTDGVDFTLDSSTPLGAGRLKWSVAANYNHNEMTRIAPIPAALRGLPDISTLSKSAEYGLLYQNPSDKEVINLTYDLYGWSFNLRENRYGRLTRLNTNTNGNYYIDAAFTTDVSITRALTRNLSLTIAGTNVFDRYPSTVPYGAQSASTKAQYVNQWNNSGPLGLLGGTYYARVEFRY